MDNIISAIIFNHHNGKARQLLGIQERIPCIHSKTTSPGSATWPGHNLRIPREGMHLVGPFLGKEGCHCIMLNLTKGLSEECTA